MNRFSKLIVSVFLSTLIPITAIAEEHEEKESHDDHSQHAQNEEHEEANEAVGPDKGITEVSHDKGFKLSAEATKTFEITSVEFKAGANVTLPKSAIFFGLEERNLFRIREGFYKRVDFKTISKSQNQYVVSSNELTAGDRIALTGIGFLRIAEIASTGGGAVGHSH